MTTIDELEARIGQELGVSAWRSVTQADIDAFADVTGDDQFIHVDVARAEAETAFGGTIAHGFLTLSLLSILGREALPAIAGRRMGVNYGLDRVRFLSPVRSGGRVRGRFVLAGLERRKPERGPAPLRRHGRDRGRREAGARGRMAGARPYLTAARPAIRPPARGRLGRRLGPETGRDLAVDVDENGELAGRGIRQHRQRPVEREHAEIDDALPDLARDRVLRVALRR